MPHHFRSSICTVAVVPAFVSALASAAVVTVGPGGSGAGYQFAEVADAIAFASAGDTIFVQARTENGARHTYAGFDLGLAAQGVSMEWGNSPGVIEVGGSMRLGPNADMLFEIGGTNAAQALTTGRVDYDTVYVTGNFTLEGRIDLTLFNGFVPSVGQSFELISTTGSVIWSGNLNLRFTAPALAGGASWLFTVANGRQGGQSIFATVVPAPGAMALLGVTGLTAARRRR